MDGNLKLFKEQAARRRERITFAIVILGDLQL
jgi:hypothetical protein